MIATIVLGMKCQNIEVQGELIGVDRGAYYCALEKQTMKMAFGDFDSLSEKEFQEVKKYALEVVHIDSVKLETDSEAIIKLLVSLGYTHFNVYGALGGRADHSWINIWLARLYPNLTLFDDYNKVYCLSQGEHQIIKSDYPYFSLFALEECELELRGVKYPISKRKLNARDLYTSSNEIIDVAVLKIHQGNVLIMETKD